MPALGRSSLSGMRVPRLLSRRRDKAPAPPLRKPGEPFEPDPDGPIKVPRGRGGQSSHNGDNRSAAVRYGPGA